MPVSVQKRLFNFVYKQIFECLYNFIICIVVIFVYFKLQLLMKNPLKTGKTYLSGSEKF